jgi:hypothetical protein
MRHHLLPALPARRGTDARAAALALATALLAGAAPAEAVSTRFAQDLGTGAVPTEFPNSRAAEIAFRAALVDPVTEDFSSFRTADRGPLEIFAAGPVTATLSDTVDAGGSIRGVLDDAANRGFAASGIQFWKNETTSNARDELFRVTFSEGVRAFGFYATAWSTESTPTMDATVLALYLERDGMAAERVAIPHGHEDLPGSVFYFGVVAEVPFLAASLRNDSTTDPGDRIGFDQFTVAIVPEPSSALLLLAGLVGLAAMGRCGSLS